MTQTTATHLKDDLHRFLDEYGDEFETCSYYGYDKLQQVIEESDRELQIQKLQDFLWDFADELDACNPDAFDIIYNLAKKLELEI